VCTEYLLEDVDGNTGTERDAAAQEKELTDMAAYICQLLDEANSVEEYQTEHPSN